MQTIDKKVLRKNILAARLAIPTAEKQALDEALCRHIAAHERFLCADALLAYLPMRGEPDLRALFAIASTRNIPIFLPRCEADGMHFLHYDTQKPLTPDRFGIPAPQRTVPEAAPTADTLCLVPGLAAGRDGARLGYGGGFYDRFLPHFKGYALFALYERFVLNALPHEAHDAPIFHVITEKGEL